IRDHVGAQGDIGCRRERRSVPVHHAALTVWPTASEHSPLDHVAARGSKSNLTLVTTQPAPKGWGTSVTVAMPDPKSSKTSNVPCSSLLGTFRGPNNQNGT